MKLPATQISLEAARLVYLEADKRQRTGAWLYCKPDHPGDSSGWGHSLLSFFMSLQEYSRFYIEPAVAALAPMLRWIDSPLPPGTWDARTVFGGWEIGISISQATDIEIAALRMTVGRQRRN